MKNVIVKVITGIGIASLLLSESLLLLENRVMSAKLNSSKEVEYSDSNQMHTAMTMMDLMENCGLVLDSCMVTSPEGEEQLLQHCLLDVGHGKDSSPMLVCRVSQYDCSVCVDYAVQRAIEAFSRDSLGIPLMLLGNYDSPAQVKALASRLDPDSVCLIYNSFWLDMPIDNHGQPYYFLVDSTCHVSCVFTPDRMDPELTDYYFNTVKHR